jgi:hypothetical protein
MLFKIILKSDYMETSVSQRFMRYLDAKGIKAGRAEKDLGLSNGYIKKLKGAPGADKLELILSRFSDLSRNWLLYGVGNMINEQHTSFNAVGSGPAAAEGTADVKILEAKVDELQSKVDLLLDQLAKKDEQIATLLNLLSKQ